MLIRTIRSFFHGFLATRGSEEYRTKMQQTRIAMEEVRNTPMREIEERIGVSEYSYPSSHRGYASHHRNRRPKSRTEELDRFRRSEKRIEKMERLFLAKTHS